MSFYMPMHIYIYIYMFLSVSWECANIYVVFADTISFHPLGQVCNLMTFEMRSINHSRHALNFNFQAAGSEKWGSGNLPRAGGAGGVAFANLGGVGLFDSGERNWDAGSVWLRKLWISLYNTYIQITSINPIDLYMTLVLDWKPSNPYIEENQDMKIEVKRGFSRYPWRSNLDRFRATSHTQYFML